MFYSEKLNSPSVGKTHGALLREQSPVMRTTVEINLYISYQDFTLVVSKSFKSTSIVLK